jgi:hypothetical protein
LRDPSARFASLRITRTPASRYHASSFTDTLPLFIHPSLGLGFKDQLSDPRPETLRENPNMKLSQTILTVLATGAIIFGLFTQAVEAVPITGDIDFYGSVTLDTTSLATAMKVVSWSETRVGSTSGSYTAIPLDNPATFLPNYIFNPASPQTPLWTTSFGGVTFSFNLLTSTIVSQSATFLNVRGTGTVTGTGFDPTFGLWSFTLRSPDGGTNQTFRFGSAALPDGGSALAFLGMALVAVEALRRRLAPA